MKMCISYVALFCAVILFTADISHAQGVKIGPRVTGNLNIYNQKNLTGTWNGIGVGVGGTVDLSFSKTIGMMVNLTVFDMRNFSNSTTQNETTFETSLSLAYITIDPMFKAEFSGFYMVGGPSLGIKINSSGEQTNSANTNVANLDLKTKSARFDIALGTGYNFNLSSGMYMGADIMAYIPVSDTYDTPGRSNSVFTLKLGVALKFSL
jgi:hypothetical protein